MADDDRRRRFEHLALPLLGTAHAFARWLAGEDDLAADVVQEAYLRAYRYFDTFRGGEFRVWLLAIVRTSHASIRARRGGSRLRSAWRRGAGRRPPSICNC